ncbi:MAG: hypothetical protein CSA07_00705 [Bacteroidia bacterium]|nr:MAG: hypothetical protein CSA07_00705 [Bacteroidia bacterium]
MGIRRIVYSFLLSLLLLGGGGLAVGRDVEGVRGVVHSAALEAMHRRGMDLFAAGKYAAAEGVFSELVGACASTDKLLLGDASYYYALCAVRLGRDDAEFLMVDFIGRFPASLHVNEGRMELGNLYYARHDWAKSKEWFDRVVTRRLGQELWQEVLFKRGYCAFQLGDMDTAFDLFGQGRNVHSYYQASATYYYGHIAYERELNETALEAFTALEGDESFAPIVPYYLAHILYRQGEYRAVVDRFTPMLDSLSGSRRLEVMRMLADANFHLGDYRAALPPMERYVKEVGEERLSRQDSYLLGFLYYQLGQSERAIPFLERAVGEHDAYTQNASYHLAAALLKTGNRERARQALSLASSLDFDRDIQEDALFNYAKLTYEMRSNPFVDAVDAFTRYLELFPSTPRVDEAYTYLGMSLSAAKDYGKALDALERISQPTPVTRRAFQRAAYFRGVELFQNARYAEAAAMFDKSLEEGRYNPSLQARAFYWNAEANYRLERYAKASRFYQEFYQAPGAFALPQYRLAPYNVGYCYFKMRTYDKAAQWFRTFLDGGSDQPVDLRSQAYARLGDCHFMAKRYWPAADAYTRADELQGADGDYALFQKAVTLGLVDRPEKRVAVLETLPLRYPQSRYVAKGRYEIALTRQSLGQLDAAKRDYLSVVRDFPTSQYAPSSLVQAGLVDFAREDLDGATKHLERVCVEYPHTEEMHEALAALERVYNARGNVRGYLAFLERVGQKDRLGSMERDSLYFSSAEGLYMAGDCAKARSALQDYLAEFPNGRHSLEVNFFLGDCLLKGGDTVAAIVPLERVAGRKPNAYYVQSVEFLGGIYERRKEYKRAEEQYSELERVATENRRLVQARSGRLRCAVALRDSMAVVETAQSLLATEQLQPEMAEFAEYHLAKALCLVGKAEEAYTHFEHLSGRPGSELSAEASFMMAKIRFDQARHQEVKDIVKQFSKQRTPHQYWLGRGFVLLGRSYLLQGDYFQANATLSSVVQHYKVKDDGVVEAARAVQEEVQRAQREKEVAPHVDTLRVGPDKQVKGV